MSCIWCLRLSGSPHPFPEVISTRHDGKLKCRAPRSLECTLCADSMPALYPKQMATKKSKAAFRSEVEQNPDRRHQVDGCREVWEKKHSRRGKGRPSKDSTPRRNRKRINKKRVTADTSGGQYEETCTGVFWPAKVYKKHFPNKNIPRRKK